VEKINRGLVKITNHNGNKTLISLSNEIKNIAVKEAVNPNWKGGRICRQQGRIGIN